MGWADLARLIHTHYGTGAAGDPSARTSTLHSDSSLSCSRPIRWSRIVLKTNDLRAYFSTASLGFDDLETLAYTIVDQYFNLAAAEGIERGSQAYVSQFVPGDPWTQAPSAATTPAASIPDAFEGDQTLANGIRRRRDSMLQYEFQYAIADGDFGRAWQVMLVM